MKDDSNFWVEESNDPLSLPLKRKRNVRSKRLEYEGWGSKPLIEFLHSVGKDTSKKLSQYEVAAIITDYVHVHKLSNPEKKKKIICDERLYSLFGKKVVSRIKIYDMLELHFAENQDSSEDDFDSEEDGFQYGRENKASNSESKPSGKRNKVPEIPKSCFAAVVPENIRLVYLKRTLIQDLLKVPENSKDKLLGSFVRIKPNHNDSRQKHCYQLQQVLGVKMTSEAGNSSSEVELQLSDYINQVPITMLSDDNFSEEECEKLHERVKAGLVKRPTVVELEAKARMLHEDIIKHWIPREISRLQKLIDRANEKGWRRELYEYLDKKQLLQKPSEHERLLSELPQVIADKLEPEAMPDALEKVEGGHSSPRLEEDLSDVNGTNGIGTGLVGILCAPVSSDWVSHTNENVNFPNGVGCAKYTDGSQVTYDISAKAEEIECRNARLVEQATIVIGDESSIKTDVLDSENNKISPEMPTQELKPPEVIELSDDEVEVLDLKDQKQASTPQCPREKVWFYMDPQGKVQGPFTMAILKKWSDAHYFHPEFKVWKLGQSQDEAVLLVDMLR